MSNFIMTNSHKKFYYENIDANSIDIMDIAHALSNICRFGGHVDNFYSVAQHSVIVSELVPQEYKLAALLHDASEAYLSDIVSPAKRILADYKSLEASVTCSIDSKFKIDTSHKYIKLADRQTLYAEAMTFFGTVDGWKLDNFYHKRKIEPLRPGEAKELFLKTYHDLQTKKPWDDMTFNEKVTKNCKCPLCKNTIIFMHGMGLDYDTEFCSNRECNYEKVYDTTSNLNDE